jgi:hypothetical protein
MASVCRFIGMRIYGQVKKLNIRLRNNKMMIAFIKVEEKRKILEFYKIIINDCLTSRYFVDSISSLIRIKNKILPAKDPSYYILNDKSILIDDILEMDSISDTEKEQTVLELINHNKNALQNLAKQLVDKIEEDEKEAKERGFCMDLIEDYTNKD